ncbi:hypothetical protein [Streptomyces silvensis]|uniref:Uncharacterized protein n=1 Tax=Streptomyces silvensis TaxID=1765722 RepID=A0A0W7WYF4_9ACTN|nr:hypothetical protein [Streptomyces silvensis]KUF15569.1 hypothetical protein AT728_26360 [Streptomyces silvensis]
MSVTQQYLLDAYRAAQHGEAAPPAPGAHDWQVVREVRDYGRFHAVVAGRPARGRVRAALLRHLRSLRGGGARTPRPLP